MDSQSAVNQAQREIQWGLPPANTSTWTSTTREKYEGERKFQEEQKKK